MGSIESLRGPFAFVGAHEGGLVLGRGRFGGHPLYYGRDRDGAVIACSRLQPLARFLGVEATLDTSRMTELLLNAPGGSATMYKGVRRPRSAELSFFDGASQTTKMLPLLRAKPTTCTNVSEIAEELARLVGVAVERAVGSAKRAAVSVGGVDSSALLATLLAQSRGASKSEVTAITLHFAGLDDDRRYVDDLCRAFAIEPVRIRPAECAPFVLNPLTIDGSPDTSPHAAWVLGMTRWAREKGVEAILDGEGGDKLFDGDLTVFVATLLGGHPLRAIRDAGRLKGVAYLGSPQRRVVSLVLRPAARSLLPRLHRTVKRRRVRGRAASEFRWAGPKLRPALDAHLSTSRTLDDLATGGEMLNYRDLCHRYWLHDRCRLVQPYLDDDLVEFVGSLPKELLFYGGYRRGLFRFAFRSMLPDSVRLRESKSGFGHAFAETFAAAGGAKRVEPYVSMRALSDLGLVEPAAFRVAFDQFHDHPTEPAHWLNIWPAIALEAFLEARNGLCPPHESTVLCENA
jgi:asparagine synthetase B (glutamine-hydrolysing)